jgi:Rhodopirellula transposase DDE domain
MGLVSDYGSVSFRSSPTRPALPSPSLIIPGTSKWNRIEHKLFAFITQNWRAKPLVSHQVIIQLIGSTKTRTGLNVHCCLDENKYLKCIKVSDREMASINLEHDSFHGEWNYTISPISSKHSWMQPSPSLSKYGPRLATDD